MLPEYCYSGARANIRVLELMFGVMLELRLGLGGRV